MGLIEKIFNLENKKQEPKKRKVVLSNLISRERTPEVKIEMDKLKQAILLAKDIEEPDRTSLYSIYEQIIEDSDLITQLRTALYTVQQSQFVIYDDAGNEIEDLKKIFDKAWFTSFIQYALDAEFWGHSLIEFSELIENEFTKITLINRYNVVPEFGNVKIKLDDDLKYAIPYRQYLTQWQLIEIGNPYDLGILRIAAREVIWKTYSKSDWSLYSEKYGMPLLSIRTDTQDPRELDKMEDYAENFGNNQWIVLSKDDEIDIMPSRNGGSGDYQLYQEFINECKEALAKLINGQTGTTDEKAFVGSAEVHERILNKYTLARLERIQRVINDKLIPFLIYWGYPLENTKFQFVDLLPKSDMETEAELSVKKKGLTII